ncbi:hypothetical protein [Bradyrhizobium sp. JYMT SZCCT0428]|uniref:hypothetical protein n=1 Tax=Bradyrhizobium sp. JYMT SZCCT0428 TaxID=2807673 RepID=UPI001BA4D534|nr:hypothetical protein [Bradyrhizobium sp. JYMT SZCCT0428]MBR1150119.1 hypothetical protein [Bradyrhizobium sp. JYMT SZCCT0428]
MTGALESTSSPPAVALDDRSTSIHWARSLSSRDNLLFIFRNGIKIAECWNRETADLLVTALRQLSDCQRPNPTEGT